MNKLGKFTLALSVASALRAARSGLRIAARQTAAAYDTINPLGGRFEPADSTLRTMSEIPERSLGGLFPNAGRIQLDGRWQFVDGALPYRDLIALLVLLTDRKPDLIFEIGTFNGATTAAMAINAPNAKVHTLDLPLDFDPAKEAPNVPRKDDWHLIQTRKVGLAYFSIPESENITQHYADSATWDYSPVKGASFFFIDGAHTYDYAKSDTEKCMTVAGPGARFLIHDCDENHDDVVRYCRDLVRQGVKLVRLKDTSIAYFDLESSPA